MVSGVVRESRVSLGRERARFDELLNSLNLGLDHRLKRFGRTAADLKAHCLNRSRVSGNSSVLLISRLMMSTMFRGVFGGATIPTHTSESESAMPCSRNVGTFGITSMRWGPATPRTFTFSDLIRPSADTVVVNAPLMVPATTSLREGPVPR